MVGGLHFNFNRQNGLNRDLNANRDWDLPITTALAASLVVEQVCDNGINVQVQTHQN